MLDVKKATQKPRENRGKKQKAKKTENSCSPPVIIWQLWKKGSYLDFKRSKLRV